MLNQSQLLFLVTSCLVASAHALMLPLTVQSVEQRGPVIGWAAALEQEGGQPHWRPSLFRRDASEDNAIWAQDLSAKLETELQLLDHISSGSYGSIRKQTAKLKSSHHLDPVHSSPSVNSKDFPYHVQQNKYRLINPTGNSEPQDFYKTQKTGYLNESGKNANQGGVSDGKTDAYDQNFPFQNVGKVPNNLSRKNFLKEFMAKALAKSTSMRRHLDDQNHLGEIYISGSDTFQNTQVSTKPNNKDISLIDSHVPHNISEIERILLDYLRPLFSKMKQSSTSVKSSLPEMINPFHQKGRFDASAGNSDDFVYDNAFRSRMLEILNDELQHLFKEAAENDKHRVLARKAVRDFISKFPLNFLGKSNIVESVVSNDAKALVTDQPAELPQSQSGISFLMSNLTTDENFDFSKSLNDHPIKVKILTNGIADDAQLLKFINSLTDEEDKSMNIFVSLAKDNNGLVKLSVANASQSADGYRIMLQFTPDLSANDEYANISKPSNALESDHLSPSNNTEHSPPFQRLEIDKFSLKPKDQLRQFDIDQRRSIDIDQSRKLDFDQTHQFNIDQPRQFKIDQPRQLNIDQPRQFNIDQPRQLNIDQFSAGEIDEPKSDNAGVVQKGKVDEKWDWQSMLKGQLPKVAMDPHHQSRGRRSLQDASVHAEECHARNLKTCGQPALRKLLKESDMDTRCSIREEFLNCMLERRYLSCPKGALQGHGAATPDLKLKTLRTELRKNLATNCFLGYSTPKPSGGGAGGSGRGSSNVT